MNEILIAVLVIGLVGLACGLALVTAGKKFYVEPDETFDQVRACMRGANCGACGYAGCDAAAEAVIKGEAHVDVCPGNSTENIAKIAAVLGKENISQDPHVAFVRCGGDCDKARFKANYVGISDCRAAALTGLSFTGCDTGCLGLESCAAVCPEKAISVQNGVAVVNPRVCVGCGLCAKTCPKGLIEMLPRSAQVAVRCSSKEKGAALKKNCTAGCLGCGLCAKACPNGAVRVENNLAQVDYALCAACGACEEKCPTGAIALRRV